MVARSVDVIGLEVVACTSSPFGLPRGPRSLCSLWKEKSARGAGRAVNCPTVTAAATHRLDMPILRAFHDWSAALTCHLTAKQLFRFVKSYGDARAAVDRREAPYHGDAPAWRVRQLERGGSPCRRYSPACRAM